MGHQYRNCSRGLWVSEPRRGPGQVRSSKAQPRPWGAGRPHHRPSLACLACLGSCLALRGLSHGPVCPPTPPQCTEATPSHVHAATHTQLGSRPARPGQQATMAPPRPSQCHGFLGMCRRRCDVPPEATPHFLSTHLRHPTGPDTFTGDLHALGGERRQGEGSPTLIQAPHDPAPGEQRGCPDRSGAVTHC